MLSAVEKQRKNKSDQRSDITFEDMSGELQTIPARHGVATFVPRGRTVKIINTYGKQVVSMWAFSLGAPPLDDDEEEAEKEGQERIDQEQVQKEAEDLKKTVEVGEGNLAEKHGTPAQIGDGTGEKETERTEKQDKTLPEQDLNAPEGDKAKESITGTSQQPQKRTWASYLPSIPYRNRNTAAKADEKQPVSAEEEKAQNEANTRKWSSYLPTGKSFSSYVPNMQLPDSKEAISSFKASHYRDPNKSYAEQLYDFSKTPVGAGTIAGKHENIISSKEIPPRAYFDVVDSCDGLWVRVFCLRCVLRLCLDSPIQLISATNGIFVSPSYTSIITQACS